MVVGFLNYVDYVVGYCWFWMPPPFLSSSLFHEHTHKTFLCSSLSHTHTQLFGYHLSYVILNSRATCFTASSERVMTGG